MSLAVLGGSGTVELGAALIELAPAEQGDARRYLARVEFTDPTLADHWPASAKTLVASVGGDEPLRLELSGTREGAREGLSLSVKRAGETGSRLLRVAGLDETTQRALEGELWTSSTPERAAGLDARVSITGLPADGLPLAGLAPEAVGGTALSGELKQSPSR